MVPIRKAERQCEQRGSMNVGPSSTIEPPAPIAAPIPETSVDQKIGTNRAGGRGRTTREYLFGRLLIADNIEQRALHLANEQRDTNAAKLMQRFADRPCSTWRSIELALTPYKTRLRTNRPAVLLERDKLLDAVIGMFKGEDFISDSRLSGEFLLGYHCQRAALWAKGKPESEFPEKDESIIQEEGV